MKRLLLTTASIIALGLATPAMAETDQSKSPPNTPSMSMPAQGASSQSGMTDSSKMSSQKSSMSNDASTSRSSMGSKSDGSASRDMVSTRPTSHKAGSTDVKQAQRALKSQGLYNGGIDGISGPMTKNAIAQFQHKQGLKESGKLDSKTRAQLMASSNGGNSNAMSGSSGIAAGSANSSASMSSGGNVKSLPSSGSLPNGAKMPTDRASSSMRQNGG